MNNNRPVQSRIRIRLEGPLPSVDGHPGWVRQSVSQYALLTGVSIGMHGFIAGAGLILNGARSAAWWITALGFLGGLLIWTPVWGVTRGEKAISLDEALAEAFGKTGAAVIMLAYSGVVLFNASIVLYTIGSFVRQYLIVGASGAIVSLAVLAIMIFSVYRYGGQGLSRLVWLFRWLLLFSIAFSCAVAVKYTYFENLFPVLGNDTISTALTLPFAMSGYAPILTLGTLPLQTGSAKPVRFLTGLKAMGIGCFISTFLMLFINLSMPPMAVEADIVLGYNLVLSVEYMRSHVIRLFYLLALSTMLFLSGGNGASAGVSILSLILNQKNKWMPAAIIFAVLSLILLLLSSSDFADAFVRLMVWRLPIASVPVWTAWGVLAVKRRRPKG